VHCHLSSQAGQIDAAAYFATVCLMSPREMKTLSCGCLRWDSRFQDLGANLEFHGITEKKNKQFSENLDMNLGKFFKDDLS
jgi:hypothetical protein